MASWDVFHADRLEVQRSLSTEAVRHALAQVVIGDHRIVDNRRHAIAMMHHRGCKFGGVWLVGLVRRHLLFRLFGGRGRACRERPGR